MWLDGTWLNPGARRQGFGADGEERLFFGTIERGGHKLAFGYFPGQITSEIHSRL